jgi:DNA-binding CsgD family transcriptional regulator/tetratricopeptide (TPR) repeat protein
MAQGTTVVARDGGLLERSAELDALRSRIEEVSAGGRGRLVFVSGEAGVGKTAVVRVFAAAIPASTRVLSGACDALFTPRPLAPFLDVATEIGGELEQAARRGVRPYEFASDLLTALRARNPSVVVLEDLHWADAATLDVLRLVARRVDSVNALIVVTFRDDELDRAHPLRILLGELPTAGAVTRIKLAPLSAAAVAELAMPAGVEPMELYRQTAGNPFFVTEILAARGPTIPATVQDAVLARIARLGPHGRNLVEALSIIPASTPLWLLEKLCPEGVGSIDECLASGVLTAEAEELAFRHELARRTVEASLPLRRMHLLHAAAMSALENPPEGRPDPARIAHHAEAAGNAGAVMQYAPAAAARASAVSAHREAAAQYQRALRAAQSAPVERRAELLTLAAGEIYLAGDYPEAIKLRRAAIECFEETGDRLRQGDAMRAISANLHCHGLVPEASTANLSALEILGTCSPGPELAMAYAQEAALALNLEDLEAAERWSRKALDLATRLDDLDTRIDALNTLGTAAVLGGDPAGALRLDQSLQLALDSDMPIHAGRAFINISWSAVRVFDFERAIANEKVAIEYCLERGLEAWRYEVLAHRSIRQLEQGAWDEAMQDASNILRSNVTNAIALVIALPLIARIRALRGDPDVLQPVEEARVIAARTGEIQHLVHVACADLELAWLQGSTAAAEAAIARSRDVLDLSRRFHSTWVAGEIAVWWRRLGFEVSDPVESAPPYALELSGDLRGAAARWRDLGCGYKAAVALTCGGNEDELRWALAEFQRLGARSAAAIAARKLRSQGVRGLRRGPRQSTLKNPANLTTRELEILGFIAEGMADAEIAQRLFLAKRTVHHHVSAILGKLGVKTRGQAAAQYR